MNISKGPKKGGYIKKTKKTKKEKKQQKLLLRKSLKLKKKSTGAKLGRPRKIQNPIPVKPIKKLNKVKYVKKSKPAKAWKTKPINKLKKLIKKTRTTRSSNHFTGKNSVLLNRLKN